MAAMLDDETKGSVIQQAATPLSFGSLGIGCKPPIGKSLV